MSNVNCLLVAISLVLIRKAVIAVFAPILLLGLVSTVVDVSLIVSMSSNCDQKGLTLAFQQ